MHQKPFTKVGLLLLIMVCGACSSPRQADLTPPVSITIPADYLTSMVLPVVKADLIVVLDGGTEGLSITDSKGQMRHVYIDRGGGPGWREITTHGRSWGEVVVGSIEQGRVLDYDGEEGPFLLAVLHGLRSEAQLPEFEVAMFEKEIKKRQKAAQPGATDNPDDAQRI